MPYHAILGVDLGSTVASVAAFNKERRESEWLFGAAGQSPLMPAIIGRSPTGELLVGAVADHFDAIAAGDLAVGVKAALGTDARFLDDRLSASEAVALLLMRLKENAEAQLGREVQDAVLTIPLAFTEPQRRSLVEAALLAGLYPRLLLPEPVAIALSHTVDHVAVGRETYLIFRIGGRSFDVTLLAAEDARIEVLAGTGEPVGGTDVDSRIAAWAADLIRQQHSVSVLPNTPDHALLLRYAEQLKRHLTIHPRACVRLSGLRSAGSVMLELSRLQLEEMIEPLVVRACEAVETVLTRGAQHGSRLPDITKVLFAGGTCQIPCVWEAFVRRYECLQTLVREDFNPAAAAARGAAIAAQALEPTIGTFEPTHYAALPAPHPDVCCAFLQYPISIEVQGGRFVEVIKSGMPRSVTSESWQVGVVNPSERLEVRVSQSAAGFVHGNTWLGDFELNWPEANATRPREVELNFQLDHNGVLRIEARDRAGGIAYRMKNVGEPADLNSRRAWLRQLYHGETTGR